MKLYRYPLSGFWNTTSRFCIQTPIYYQEVLPGQSLHGKVRFKIVTDSLIKIALNRMWYDTFFFYIPFRLLWDEFPQWISGDDSVAGNLPLVTDTWLWNFEGLFVASATQNVAWQRYAYNYVWNKALRGTDQAEVTLSDANPLEVLNRARSFQNVLNDGTLPDETVAAGAFTIDTLRNAMTEQRRQRREFFFDGPQNREYLSLLERMGVSAGWEIDEEPRLIGQYHAQATFETVMNTGTTTASPSGLFSGQSEIKFGSKFFPEHGIVIGVCVPRMEFGHIRAGNITPMLQKNDRKYYFTDGQLPRPPAQWSERFGGMAAQTVDLNAPAWEDYRTPVSQMFASEDTSAPWDKNYALIGENATPAPSELRNFRQQVDPSDFFRGFLGTGEVAIYSEVSGFQRSPVPPPRS